MKVKGQGFLHAVAYLGERFGQDKLASVMQQCSLPVQKRRGSLLGSEWHDASELCELIETAERVLGATGGTLAEEIGAAGARANLKGMVLRAAFYFGEPTYLMTRVAGMWNQFNGEGALAVLEMTGQKMTLELTGITEPRRSFCRTITGWCIEMARALGVKDARATHLPCRARGGKRCVWEIRGMAPG